MTVQELVSTIFQVCIIPLLGVLTTFVVSWINAKTKNLQAQTDNELANKYIALLDTVISNCVIMVTQTYVETLKEQGRFDAEAQQIAFQKCYEMVLLSLTEEANEVLNEVIGDLTVYITSKIESEIVNNKRR